MVSIHRLEDEKEAKKDHENGEDSIVVGEEKLETPNPDVITWSFVVNTL